MANTVLSHDKFDLSKFYSFVKNILHLSPKRMSDPLAIVYGQVIKPWYVVYMYVYIPTNRYPFMAWPHLT